MPSPFTIPFHLSFLPQPCTPAMHCPQSHHQQLGFGVFTGAVQTPNRARQASVGWRSPSARWLRQLKVDRWSVPKWRSAAGIFWRTETPCGDAVGDRSEICCFREIDRERSEKVRRDTVQTQIGMWSEALGHSEMLHIPQMEAHIRYILISQDFIIYFY